jgi:COMPASS component SWD3
LPAHSDPVTSVSFSRDGTVVCSASHDGLIRLWDVPTGECLKTIYAAGNPPVCTAKFSPNAKYVLAGTLMDATLRLWPVHRTGSNQCARSYQDAKHHTNSKYSIAADFTHDGNIVTGSETGQVVVYDLQSGATQQVLEGHSDAVLAVAAHDRYPLLASGSMSADRRVHFWSPADYELPSSEPTASGTAAEASN